MIGIKLTGTLSGLVVAQGRHPRSRSGAHRRGQHQRSSSTTDPAPTPSRRPARRRSATWGAEIGATCSVFAYDQNMAQYLKATGREDDRRCRRQGRRAPARRRRCGYDRVVEIDLDQLKPLINRPTLADRLTRSERPASAPRLARTTGRSDLGRAHRLVHQLLLREDIRLAASVARQAAAKGLRAKCDLLVSPARSRSAPPSKRDGLMADLEAIGATVLAGACGPCIGQWERAKEITDHPNSIVNSFNRNFPKRNDGSANTLSFVTSPDTVIALALAGRLDFSDDRHDHQRRGCRGDVGSAGRRGPAERRLRQGREHLHRPARRRHHGVSVGWSPTSDRLRHPGPSPPGTATTSPISRS
ncbi:MAG: aconitase family protein [Ilumatobacteraceae bacterium]